MGREGRLAQEFPTGLKKEDSVETESGRSLRVIQGMKGRAINPLDELSYGKPVRQHVREFGAVMGLLACVIAYFQIAKHHVSLMVGGSILLAGVLVYCIGLFAPQILKPTWQAWMKFAHYLGLVMTTVLLTAMWVAVVIPIGVAVKVLGIKIMDMRFRAPVNSYWEDRAAGMDDFKLLERQW